MLIYKILTAGQWAQLRRDGQSAGAPVDMADGFVHFSSRSQVAGTAVKHFAGQDGLTLVAVEAGTLGDALRWEPSRDGDLFPHLYGPLRMGDAAWTCALLLGPDGAHVFPERVS